MPLSEEQNQHLAELLEGLSQVQDQIKGSSQGFVKEQISRHEKFGAGIFISPKQLKWLEDLHQEYVGDIAATPKEERGVDERLKERERDRDRDDLDDDEVAF